MSRATGQRNRWMLRARDAMDRSYAEPLDIPVLAVTHGVPSCFTRAWTRPSGFGEATVRELLAEGVEFTKGPEERQYGIDCALRDPFGNHIRITRRA